MRRAAPRCNFPTERMPLSLEKYLCAERSISRNPESGVHIDNFCANTNVGPGNDRFGDESGCNGGVGHSLRIVIGAVFNKENPIQESDTQPWRAEFVRRALECPAVKLIAGARF